MSGCDMCDECDLERYGVFTPIPYVNPFLDPYPYRITLLEPCKSHFDSMDIDIETWAIRTRPSP